MAMPLQYMNAGGIGRPNASTLGILDADALYSTKNAPTPILRTLSPTERKQRVGKSPTLSDNQPTSDSMTQVQFLSSREMQRKYEISKRTFGAMPIYSTGNTSRRIMHCHTIALPSFVSV
ncbi:predicted protein [Botrytis cinerea T4]|uniref:Uncharacterized protein n=1 Tax=Botryotinia fuckeliana (strain T4) TaxID=999810 RepID=G2XTB1_BOTF4|nr:predicted protein [Botrytis cinerea T4]